MSDLVSYAGEGAPCLVVVGSQRDGFGQRSRGATEIPALCTMRFGAAYISDGAVVARVRVREAAIGEQLETVDRVVERTLLEGRDGALEQGLVGVALGADHAGQRERRGDQA